MELSDWELVKKCQAGEIEAFQELVAKYHHRVFLVILGILNHREDALEVAQETFLRVYKKIKGFRGGSSFYTWIYRIAVNLSIDFQRHQKRSPLEFRESLDDVMERQEESGHDPFFNLQKKEIGKHLLAAINELTPDHRAIIVMRAVEGLSYKDISRILGCSEGTVMSRLHYARKKLQGKLSPFL